MFWHASVLPSICLSMGGGGVTISHNALQHFPECHGANTGGVPCQVQPGGGTLLGGGQGTQVGSPRPGQDGRGGGNPVRTTQGVLTTQRAVCLLRSRRRTFLFRMESEKIQKNKFYWKCKSDLVRTFSQAVWPIDIFLTFWHDLLRKLHQPIMRLFFIFNEKLIFFIFNEKYYIYSIYCRR